MENNIKLSPLEDKVITNVVTFGDKNNCIVVETVASYYSYFNFKETPSVTTKEYIETYVDYNGVDKERRIVENIPINYDFNKNPIINLIFDQTIKIILNGEEKTQKTKTDLARIFTIYPKLLNEIVEDIMNNSSYWNNSDKGLG